MKEFKSLSEIFEKPREMDEEKTKVGTGMIFRATDGTTSILIPVRNYGGYQMHAISELGIYLRPHTCIGEDATIRSMREYCGVTFLGIWSQPFFKG